MLEETPRGVVTTIDSISNQQDISSQTNIIEQGENIHNVSDSSDSGNSRGGSALDANPLVIGFRIFLSVWRICWLELAILSFLTLVIAAPILRISYSDTGETSLQLKEAFDKALFLYLPVRLLVALALLFFSRMQGASPQRPLARLSASFENLLTLASVILTYISTIYLRSRGFWELQEKSSISGSSDPELFAKRLVGVSVSASGGRLNGLESIQADVGLTVVIAVGFVLIYITAQVISCAPCRLILRLIRNRRAD